MTRAKTQIDDTAEGLFRAALAGDLVGGPFERARLQVAYGVAA
jgi:hypothetical protein